MSKVTRRNFFGMAAAAPAVAVAAIEAAKASEVSSAPAPLKLSGCKLVAVCDGPVTAMTYYDNRLYWITDSGLWTLSDDAVDVDFARLA